MASLGKENVDKHFPRRETVVLHFDEKDSQIALDWSKSSKKEVVDGEA
jgi:hypothetical protein